MQYSLLCKSARIARESAVTCFEPLLTTGFPLFIQAFHDTNILDGRHKIIYILRNDFLPLRVVEWSVEPEVIHLNAASNQP